FPRFEKAIFAPGIRRNVGVWKQRRKDGTLLDVEVHTDEVVLEGRRLKLAVLLDVTEKARLEEQFRQSQKMEAVGRLAGGTAHDFNSLLTIINGYAGLVLTKLPVSSPEKEPLTEVVRAGER